MIKIIKEGKKEFKAICPICGCEFSYELEDLQQTPTYKIVKCPCCGRGVTHKECINQVVIPRNNTGNDVPSDQAKIWGDMLYQMPEYQELQKTLENQVNSPSYIDCNRPKSPCENCSYYHKWKSDEIYVGDSPCQWCQYSGLKITCTSSGVDK